MDFIDILAVGNRYTSIANSKTLHDYEGELEKRWGMNAKPVEEVLKEYGNGGTLG